MRAFSYLREQEEKNNVDWLIVDGSKVDPMMQTSKEAEWCLKTPQPGVRECHTISDAGRSKLLAFGDLVKDFVRVQAELARRLS